MKVFVYLFVCNSNEYGKVNEFSITFFFFFSKGGTRENIIGMEKKNVKSVGLIITFSKRFEAETLIS